MYHSLLHGLASWGFVVAAPRACLDGECLHTYYEQPLAVIDYAREHTEVPVFAVGAYLARVHGTEQLAKPLQPPRRLSPQQGRLHSTQGSSSLSP